MARIAVLLSGFTRNHQLSSLAEHVIRPNTAAGHDVDVYVSTWDTRGTVTTVDAGDPVFTGREYWSGDVRSYDNTAIEASSIEDDVRAITPGRASFRYHRYEDRARQWLAEMPAHLDGVRGKDHHTMLRIRGMWFGIDDVFGMVEDPRSYDFIVRTRFDICFTEPVVVRPGRRLLRRPPQVVVGDRAYSLDAPQEDTAHVERVRSRAGTLPPRRTGMLVPERDNGYVDDWFAIGPPEAMARHMTTSRRLTDYFATMATWPEPFESESITVLNALTGGVGLVRFPKTIHQ